MRDTFYIQWLYRHVYLDLLENEINYNYLPVVTRALKAAATLMLITWAARFPFIWLWTPSFICLLVTLDSRWYTRRMSNSHSYNMSCHLAEPVSCSSFTGISQSTFATSYFRKRLRVHLRRWGGSELQFLDSETWRKVHLSNTQLFQGLDVVGIHVTHSGTNLCSFIIAGIKNLHQEINKHFTLSASMNQVAATFYIDHRAWKPQHDLQYCLSCHAFQGPQNPQYSQTSDCNAISLWLTFHQTWDNTHDIHQVFFVQCLWVY